nr:CAP domain-containing protein [Mycolicibacillus trivialis]
MVVAVSAIVALGLLAGPPAAQGDNKRLNDGVVANVYTVQQQAGCTNDVRINPQLQLAAEWHTRDLMNNRNLDGDVGSDGSGPQERAHAAGYHGQATETVAIHPANAISGVDLINRWYHNPSDFAVMSNCANTQIGVWSENSMDRTVVVAVYGQPERDEAGEADIAPAPPPDASANLPIGPTPDYDGSDEIEFGVNWFAWILRGVYPPPNYPPQ